jgi:NADH dehydrogenase
LRIRTQGKYEHIITSRNAARVAFLVILLTGSTGLVGRSLLERLLAAGEDVRCLVRDPRRLGPNRVRVQITMGDLANPFAVRQAVRGVDTVVHLAATIRDQPGGSIEELNAVATIRLLREARLAGASRFLFFGAMGATETSPARFFRAKALAEQAVLSSGLDATVLAPSIVYAPDDPWLTLLRRLSLLPWMPVSGSGEAAYQPIWAEDVAASTEHALSNGSAVGRRLELAGPETLTYEQIVRLALEAWGRARPLIHVPLPVVRRALRLVESVSGVAAFATWEEAQLMEIPMTTANGTSDAESLGVDPKRMREVLGLPA